MSRIVITKGDTARLQIRVKLNGEYLNLDDYTFESYYRKEDGTLLTIDDSAHEPVADQSDEDNTGKMIVTIDSDDTEDLKVGRNFDLIFKLTDDEGNVLHYHGKNMLEVRDNEPQS